jgi:hypothetical protein
LLRDEYPLYKKDKTLFKDQFGKIHFQEDIVLFIAVGMLARNQDLFVTIYNRGHPISLYPLLNQSNSSSLVKSNLIRPMIFDRSKWLKITN